MVRNIKCEIMFCSLDWTSHSVPHRSNIFHKYLLVSRVENVLLVEQLVDQLVDQSISVNDGISTNYDPMKSQSLCSQIRLSSSETRFRSTPYFPSPLLAVIACFSSQSPTNIKSKCRIQGQTHSPNTEQELEMCSARLGSRTPGTGAGAGRLL